MVASVQAPDPVQASLHAALLAARKAQQAVYAATSGGELSQEVRRGAYRLERLLGSDALFERSSENEIRTWCDRFEMLAMVEKQSIYVHDEYCMSGGYEQEIYSDLGHRLRVAFLALSDVGHAMNHVLCHLDAERLADKLRGQP